MHFCNDSSPLLFDRNRLLNILAYDGICVAPELSSFRLMGVPAHESSNRYRGARTDILIKVYLLCVSTCLYKYYYSTLHQVFINYRRCSPDISIARGDVNRRYLGMSLSSLPWGAGRTRSRRTP